jgi:hypothetical protein
MSTVRLRHSETLFPVGTLSWSSPVQLIRISSGGTPAAIATVAHTVRAEPGARVLVVGKADTVGSASQNWSLSRKRAQAVKDSLSQIGLLLRSRKTIVRLENTIR